jgi:plastocyanin
MKSWYLMIILILLIISLGFTANLSDKKYGLTGKATEQTQPPSYIPEVKEENLTDYSVQTSETVSQDSIAFVEISDMEFIPDEITIGVNTTVVWINNDWTGYYGRVHMVVSSTNEFRSPHLLYNETFSYLFTEPGNYKYIDPIYRSYAFGGVIIKPATIHVI